MKNLDTKIKNRIDTSENWNSSTIILLNGEIGIEKIAEGHLVKIGNGVDSWSQLPYFSGGTEVNLKRWEAND